MNSETQTSEYFNTMSDDYTLQYIYYCYNTTMWWFDNHGIPNLDGIGVPHHLCKIGLTTQRPQDRLSSYNGSNTGMPKPYRFKRVMRVNDCNAAETRVHNILKEQGRWCHQGAPGLGTEWFFATEDMIETIFSTIIRVEFNGEFVDPPLPNPVNMMAEDIRKIVKDNDLTTSSFYNEVVDKFALPPEPWKNESPYYYLNPHMRGHPQLVPIGVFVDKLRIENVRTTGDYESMLAYHPECRLYPSLDNITDGYFDGFKSFTELMNTHFPRRMVRR